MFSFNQEKNDLDEVVFSNRNKAYGAYALRKQYDSRLVKSVYSSLALLLLIFGFAYFSSIQTPVLPYSDIDKNVIFDAGNFEIVPDNPPASSGATAEPVRQATASTPEPDPYNIQIVRDPAQATPLSTTNTPAATPGAIPGTAGTTSGTRGFTGITGPITTPVPTPPATPEFTTSASVMPKFPGGTEALREFLRTHIEYPASAKAAGVTGKVWVSFVVMEDGSLAHMVVERSPGFGLGEEAVRVLLLSPNWEPASQNGKLVPVKIRVPITFEFE